MPRKKAAEAQAEDEALRRARIRYLLRNPEFQHDLNELRRIIPTLADVAERMSRIWDAEEKWDVRSLVRHSALFGFAHADLAKLFQRPNEFCKSILLCDDELWRPLLEENSLELSSATIPVFERILTSDVRDSRLVQDVSSVTTGDKLIVWLNLASHRPVDSLCALVDARARNAINQFRSAKGSTAPKTRRRLDRVDFYLTVYDRAESAQTFSAIARALKQRVSTVKSAYLAASRQIFGQETRPSKKALPLTRFDAEAHCQKCAICQKARTPEELCPKALAYANQDRKAQRELTGYDSTR